MGTDPSDLLTLEELCARTGISVRNVRFYTTRGLVPAPLRRGRQGFYTPDHVVRLELVSELQAHGFTLAAIEKYVARIPAGATPAEIALHRALLAPWHADPPEEMSRAELGERAGRALTDDELETLRTLGVVRPVAGEPDTWQVSAAYLSLGAGLLDVGFPVEAAVEADRIYTQHAREIAEEITDVFRKRMWPTYRDRGVTPEQLTDFVERLQPLSIARLVTAYSEAINETKREAVERRTRD